MAAYAFVYPQIKKLTGAQRLILRLASHVACAADQPPVILVTHRFAAECRPALDPAVQLAETGRNLNLTGNHYADSLIEYLSVPFLLQRIFANAGRTGDAICFFGPPSLPGLTLARLFRRMRANKPRLLYFCYEPPRAAYTDRAIVSRKAGRLGRLVGVGLWLYRPLDRWMARGADRILVNGAFGQQLIRETYGRDSTIIAHGVDLPQPTPDAVMALAQRWGIGTHPDFVALTVNHLHPRKRVDLFLRALAEARKSVPNVRGLIVGQGVEEAALKRLAAELGLLDGGLPGVVFAGFVPDADLAATYALADVYVHTGRQESFGLSILEAMVVGRAVVAVDDDGGPHEIIVPNKTGLFVPATSQAIAAALCDLAANPARLATMGDAAQAHARSTFSWERGAQTFICEAQIL